MTHLRKRLLFIAATLVLLVLVALAIRPAPVPVEVSVVQRGPLRVTIDEEGRTRVRDRYVVVAPATGRVGRITLTEGDAVTPGAIVALLSAAPLDPRARQEAAARVESAEDARQAAVAAAAQNRTALDQAKRSRARAESLFSSNLMSLEQREQAALAETTAARQLEVAVFRAQAAAHDADVARAAEATTTGTVLALRSPIRGRVLRIPEKSERVVTAGTELLELGDPRRLEIVVDLLSEDAVKVKPGDRVLIDGWGGDRPLEAHVRMVEPSGFTKVSALGVEEQRVNVVADLDTTPPQLGDGYRVEARVVQWEGNALKVPASALYQEGDQWHVFVVENGRARARTVRVGHRNPDEAEVLDGLSVGERVIRQPTDKISDAVRVRVRLRE
jgi:HlyD family secretion protein